MPPDLNSVPASPRLPDSSSSINPVSRNMSPSLSRRTSSNMAPPPVPQNSSYPSSPRPAQSVTASLESSVAAIGSGPLRHPRPLTAAELHLELEKEQEGIVNRLTRELSQLRAQTASVASTTSTSSELFSATADSSYPYPPFTSSSNPTPIIPTSARRHRSSSNLSTRSARSIRDPALHLSVSGVAAPREQSQSQSQREREAASTRPSVELTRPDISRQNSQHYRDRGPSVPASPYIPHTLSTTHHPTTAHRQSTSTSTNASLPPPQPYHVDPSGSGGGPARSPSFSAAVAAARYEEAIMARAELEGVKRENEVLRERIRELERKLAAES